MFVTDLWDGMFGAAAVNSASDGPAWIRALCDVESALARAQSELGLLGIDDAEHIADACDAVAHTDPAVLGVRSSAEGTPVIELVRLLRAELADRHGTKAAAAVHLGATSQDIVDTAAMLVVRRSLDPMLRDLSSAANAAADLAGRHRSSAMAARTLLQQAVPTTFGAVAITWAQGLDRAHHGLITTRAHLCVQLGGAGGTLAAWHPHGPRLRAALAEQLELVDPGVVWHSERSRIADIASDLAIASGACAKVATDIVLMAQTEVSELREANPGGSSAMPHKANPVSAVMCRAAAAHAPGLLTILMTAMSGEYQRAAGAWQSEWLALSQLLQTTGGATRRLGDSLTGITIDIAAMRSNLEVTSGLLLSDRVAAELTGRIGRPAALDVLERAARTEGGLQAALLADPQAGLTAVELERLLDPQTALGHAEDLVTDYLSTRTRTP